MYTFIFLSDEDEETYPFNSLDLYHSRAPRSVRALFGKKAEERERERGDRSWIAMTTVLSRAPRYTKSTNYYWGLKKRQNHKKCVFLSLSLSLVRCFVKGICVYDDTSNGFFSSTTVVQSQSLRELTCLNVEIHNTSTVRKKGYYQPTHRVSLLKCKRKQSVLFFSRTE